jgi:hypothetical protein
VDCLIRASMAERAPLWPIDLSVEIPRNSAQFRAIPRRASICWDSEAIRGGERGLFQARAICCVRGVAGEGTNLGVKVAIIDLSITHDLLRGLQEAMQCKIRVRFLRSVILSGYLTLYVQ